MVSRPQTVICRKLAGCAAALALAVLPVRGQTPRPIFQASDQPVPVYIAPERPSNRPGDRVLAQWALDAWSKATGGALAFRPAEERTARLRVYWVSAQDGLYGEMRPIVVEGRPGAAVFVRPELEGLGDDIVAQARADSLFRDTIVYLTCLHEIGHALGLEHTADYEDIMFFFGYGGDIPNYFQRYRRKLQRREDIPRNWGLSESDIRRIRQLYPAAKAGLAAPARDNRDPNRRLTARRNAAAEFGFLQLDSSVPAQESDDPKEADEDAGSQPLMPASSTAANQIDQSELVGLPLNGRSYSQLATLQAGVNDPGAASGSRGIGAGGLYIAGARSASNVFLLDGTNIMDSRNQVPRSAAGVQLGSDAVIEVQVFSTNYGPEYGRGSGGILNSVTKSGTPEFHGTLFEFLRNSSLDAKNFFDPLEEPIPPFKRNQFGFTLTGPVVKDRTFLMGSFEGLRDRLTQTKVDFFPDQQARRGQITNEAGEIVKTVPLHPRIPDYLELYPLPNAGRVGEGIGRNVASQFLPTNESFFTARLDHQITERDSFFARYTFDDATSQDAQETYLFNMLTNTRQQYLTLVGSHIFNPSVLTALRLGFTRPSFTRETTALQEIPAGLFFVPGAPQFGTLGIPGLSEFGPNRATPDTNVMSTFQFAGDGIVQRGRHALKMGAEVHRYRWDLFSSSRLGAQWDFNSLEDFLQGGPNGTSLEVALPGADNRKAFRQSFLGLYFQDSYAVRSGLRLSLGLRYEYASLIRERDGKTVFLADPLRDSAVQVGPLLQSNPSLGNISPRLGLSWSPGGGAHTVLRAGFGVYYDHFLEYVADQLKNTAPFFNVAVVTNADASGAFPDAVAVADAAAAAGALPLQALVMDYQNTASPIVFRYDFAIERQLPEGWRAGVSYVGARGNHLFRTYEMNLFPNPEARADGSLFFPPDQGPVNPAFQGGINIIGSDAQSFYNSLRIAANKSLSRGVSLRGSYTFSKSVDDASVHGGSTASPVQYGLRRTLERGLSNFDIRHRVALDYLYVLPFGSGQRWWGSGPLGLLFGGWRVGGILSLRSGTPFTPLVRMRSPGFLFAANRPNLVPGYSTNPTEGVTGGCHAGSNQEVRPGQSLGGPDLLFDPCAFEAPAPGTLGNVGRNTMISPRVFSTDISLQREFALDSKRRVQFRAEIFNLPNHPNFSETDRASSVVFSGASARRNPSTGKVVSTVTTARQIQFALRFSF